jgi:hypothetical protein
VSDLGDRLSGLLISGIDHQQVEAAELLFRIINQLQTEFFIGEIAGELHEFDPVPGQYLAEIIRV